MANAAKAPQRKTRRAVAPRDEPRKKKRAIALAGGGPAAGLHIGALSALEERGVTFDVWSLSCIGAWVGVYYNQLKDQRRASQTHAFFREHAFRDTASYRGFPVNKAFAPHLQAYAMAWLIIPWIGGPTGTSSTSVTNCLTWQRDGPPSGEPRDVAARRRRECTCPNNVLAANLMARYLISLTASPRSTD
jgi:hypothetical protein